MFSLINRGILPSAVTDEFEKLTGKLRGLWLSQHNEDGSHGTVVADSIVVNGFPMEDVVDIPYSSQTFRTYAEDSFGIYWTVTAANQYLLRYCCIGRMAFVQFYISDTTVSAGNPFQLALWIPKLIPMDTNSPFGFSGAYQYRVGNFEWSCTDGISIGYGAGTVDVAVADNGGVNLWLAKEYSGTTARVWYPTSNLTVRGTCTFMLAEA